MPGGVCRHLSSPEGCYGLRATHLFLWVARTREARKDCSGKATPAENPGSGRREPIALQREPPRTLARRPESPRITVSMSGGRRKPSQSVSASMSSSSHCHPVVTQPEIVGPGCKLPEARIGCRAASAYSPCHTLLLACPPTSCLLTKARRHRFRAPRQT